MMVHSPGFKDLIEQLLSIFQDRKCELAFLKWDFTPNCFSKYKIIRVLDHDLSVCITQDDKIKLLRVGGGGALALQSETRIVALGTR